MTDEMIISTLWILVGVITALLIVCVARMLCTKKTVDMIRLKQAYDDCIENFKMSFDVDIRKLSEEAVIPTRGSDEAAGYDIYALLDEDEITVQPHETVMIGTGISMAIPDGYYGAFYPRSGMASKKGLRPANTPSCIDSDYRGELKVALHNDTNVPQFVKNKERIVQMLFLPYVTVDFNEVEELDGTDRGDGGFGSTGTH